MIDPRVIVALDYPDARSAVELASRLDPGLCRLKVGKELYTAAGPSLIEKLRGSGFGIFLDLKFHDIPGTVAGACVAAAELDVWMINVHALGGRAASGRECISSFIASSQQKLAISFWCERPVTASSLPAMPIALCQSFSCS